MYLHPQMCVCNMGRSCLFLSGGIAPFGLCVVFLALPHFLASGSIALLCSLLNEWGQVTRNCRWGVSRNNLGHFWVGAFKWRYEIVQDTSSADMREGAVVMVAASSVGAPDDGYTGWLRHFEILIWVLWWRHRLLLQDSSAYAHWYNTFKGKRSGALYMRTCEQLGAKLYLYSIGRQIVIKLCTVFLPPDITGII